MMTALVKMKKTALIAMALLPLHRMEAGALRVSNQAEAKERLSQNPQAALAIFLRGSDWCKAGEVVKSRVWDSDGFAALLPAHMVLMTQNLPEAPLESLAGKLESAAKKAGRITAVCGSPRGKNGTRYARLGDGSWAADEKGPDPDCEILSQVLRFRTPAHLLRMTALPSPARPELGPGRAGNGNFVLTEIELRVNGKTRPLAAAAANADRRLPAWQCCDGNLDADNGWAPGPGREPRALFLFPLDGPIPAGAPCELKVHSLHKSKKHTLFRYRIDAFGKEPWLPSQTILWTSKNAPSNQFFRAGGRAYPAVDCFDAKGDRIGSIPMLSIHTTAEQLAAAIREILERRGKWEALEKKADGCAGRSEQIRQLADAWRLMREAEYPGDKRIEQKILKLDPGRADPWTWSILPDRKQIDGKLKEIRETGDKQAEIDYLDSLLKDPLLSKIPSGFRQDLAFRKFTVYRNWEGRKDDRFRVLQEVIDIDPESHLALGARGYINMHGRGDPTFSYGWLPKHLRTGDFPLRIRTGVPIRFYKPGFYRVTLGTARSKKAVHVQEVTLLSGEKRISTDRHPAVLEQKKDTNQVYRVELPEGCGTEKLNLQIRMSVPEGHEHSGHVQIEPYLPAGGKFGWR